MTNVVRVGRADRRRDRDEIDELLMRIKGLVLVRAILEERGVGDEVLAQHSHELERLRERLAQLVVQDAAA